MESAGKVMAIVFLNFKRVLLIHITYPTGPQSQLHFNVRCRYNSEDQSKTNGEENSSFCSTITITLVHILLVKHKTCLRICGISDTYISPLISHLFPQLKQHLGGIWANKDDLKEKVNSWLTIMAAD